MLPKEIDGKQPDAVMTAADGRRIELYGKPSKELLAQAVCRVLIERTYEEAKKKCENL